MFCEGIKCFINISSFTSCDMLKPVGGIDCFCVLVLMICVKSALMFSLDYSMCLFRFSFGFIITFPKSFILLFSCEIWFDVSLCVAW